MDEEYIKTRPTLTLMNISIPDQGLTGSNLVICTPLTTWSSNEVQPWRLAFGEGTEQASAVLPQKNGKFEYWTLKIELLGGNS